MSSAPTSPDAEPPSNFALSDSFALAQAARDGDRDALGVLLARYEARVRRIARVRLGPQLRSRLESMDVVQDAFAVAVRKIGELDLSEEAALLRWLSRVVQSQISQAVSYYGAEKRSPAREQALGEGSRLQADPSGGGSSPLEQNQSRELRERVDAALAQLPESWREVVLLRDYCGGSWAFVARELGLVSEEAARKQHARARVRLGTMLGPDV